MKKFVLVLGVMHLLFLAVAQGIPAQEYQWQEISRGNMQLSTVLVDAADNRVIYFGSTRGVFKTGDGAETWRNVLSIRGQNRQVNFLMFDPKDKSVIYAATGEGLFYSANNGNSWKKVFRGKDYSERACTSLAVVSGTIYLGTKAGLYTSVDKGRSWYKESGQLGKSHILTIALSSAEPKLIYVASVDGVFKRLDKELAWKEIFNASATQDGQDAQEVLEDQDEEARFSDIRHISINPNNINEVYLGTKKGIYFSQDSGNNWQALPGCGLLSQDIKFLLLSGKSQLYALTKSGVFVYKDKRWYELSLGLMANEFNFLALDAQDNLYVSTDKGLFKSSIRKDGFYKHDDIAGLYLKNEPRIQDVQQAAIKYAEVEPEKIMRWRKQAAKKALLPQVSIGIDRDATDLWHWEGGSTTKTDDDTLRRGRDTIDWDVTLSWDLGELVWNDDQASIDVRSRLMVQLRDDVLDEVTKLYFERLRVKMESDNIPIEDVKKRCENQLRLAELSASLDALTGGYFSQK